MKVKLAKNLDVAAAAPLSEQIALLSGSLIEIDASGVGKLGGQCLQVLLAAAMAATQDGSTFSVENASPAFLQSIEAYGLNLKNFSSQASAI